MRAIALATILVACTGCSRPGNSTAVAPNAPSPSTAPRAAEEAHPRPQATRGTEPETQSPQAPESEEGRAAPPLVAARDDTPAERVARYRALWKSPRHHPAAVDEPPRPARLAPGGYACKVSREYRLRACTVERDADGRTFLEFAEGNLLGMRGVVYDRAGVIEFEGWLTDEQPFGCTSCQDRCIAEPGSCGCTPLPPAAVVECLKQPLRITLRSAGGGRYRGALDYRVYYNEYVGEGAGRHPKGYIGKKERFEIELVPGAPPAPRE